jgi:glycerol-3-phosphate dehydrogenase
MADGRVDLLVVGGGINGVGIARDAAGRGLSVMLVEQDDLASHTSSWSSKLIHGGLRYLEHYEFRLVRESLIEREVLLRAAPHVIAPLELILPHSPEQRPAWMIRLGLFLYDHLGGRHLLPGSRRVPLAGTAHGAPLQPWVTTAFSYADCRVDDSRLVVLNAIDARERGATILTRTRCIGADRSAEGWEVRLEDSLSGKRETVEARVLVNASGPWVSQLLQEVLALDTRSRVRLVKGSHIVTRRLYDGEHAYILQNDDGRIVFVIPYENAFSLIGTTDLAFAGDPGRPAITADETEYLCRVVNRYLANSIGPSDVVWSFAGVRPLYDDASTDPSAVTRDYVLDLDLDVAGGGAPLLSVFGGKLTTYRKLAEHALEKLQPVMGFAAGNWTAESVLPGGDIADADLGRCLTQLCAKHPWLPKGVARRLARSYGTRARRILAGAECLDDLGADLGGGLREAELAYLAREEWARDAEDVLWRRSKLGLHVGPEVAGRVQAWLAQRRRNEMLAAMVIP